MDSFSDHSCPSESAQTDTVDADRSACEGNALPASYFQELLKLPSCKSHGFCDNCGKCEH